MLAGRGHAGLGTTERMDAAEFDTFIKNTALFLAAEAEKCYCRDGRGLLWVGEREQNGNFKTIYMPQALAVDLGVGEQLQQALASYEPRRSAVLIVMDRGISRLMMIAVEGPSVGPPMN